MAILKIARMGHPVLRRRAQEIEDPTAPVIRTLIGDMLETMEDADGAGLAAPQVHVPLRLVIFHVPPERAEDEDGETPVPLTVLINPVVESALADVRAQVHQGVPIAQPLVENPVFPPLVSQMVKVGEETGELERMLDKIADFYEDEVDTSIAALTSIVEPLMMIGVGAIVGVIIIAMYLPMFKLLELVQ